MRSSITGSFAVILLFGFLAAEANEGGGHEATPPPAAEGHGGGAAPGASAGKETQESGRQSMEWMELVGKVSTAKSKLEAQRSVMLQLLEQKKGIEKQEALTKHIQIMSEENKKLHKMIDEYEEQRNLLQYRFPEKGITELRKYERIEKRSLEEFETEISVEGQLKKTVGKMKKQYKAPPEPKTKVTEEDVEQTHRALPPKKKPAKVEEPDSITSSIKIVK